MFRNPLHISIPNPCSMSWEAMAYVDDSKRLCSSCEKVIVDFTQMSDAELISYFNKNKKYCGRFASHQLNRKIIPANYAAQSWKRALLLPSFLLAIEAASQTPQANSFSLQVQAQQNTSPALSLTTPPASNNDTVIVKGIVADSLEPLIGCVIVAAGSTSIHAVSDWGGAFSLKVAGVSYGDALHISVYMTGYDLYEKTIIVTPAPIEILMNQSYAVTMGDMVDPHPVRSRVHRFFWRLFHWRSL